MNSLAYIDNSGSAACSLSGELIIATLADECNNCVIRGELNIAASSVRVSMTYNLCSTVTVSSSTSSYRLDRGDGYTRVCNISTIADVNIDDAGQLSVHRLIAVRLSYGTPFQDGLLPCTSRNLTKTVQCEQELRSLLLYERRYIRLQTRSSNSMLTYPCDTVRTHTGQNLIPSPSANYTMVNPKPPPWYTMAKRKQRRMEMRFRATDRDKVDRVAYRLLSNHQQTANGISLPSLSTETQRVYGSEIALA